MPLDFQRHSRPPGERPRRQAPPNYLARSVQRRLLLLVGSLMLVVILASKVREPAFWSFLGFQRPIAGGPPLTSAERVDDEIDTRLRAPASDSIPSRSGDSGSVANAEQLEPADLAEKDAWRSLLTEASGDDQLLLYAALDRALQKSSLSTDDRAAWNNLTAKFDRGWSEYVRVATNSLQDMPEAERPSWQEVVQQLERRWADTWRPRLERLGTADDSDGDASWIPALRTQLDQAVWAAIRDDMVARPQEKAAWFRWLAQVRDLPPEALQAQSVGPTGFLQLYKQPQEYRGKVVTVRGVVHLAYHVDAPANREGIPGYYLFWLRPAGGPNSPIVIYSLETPPGFPAIRDKQRDGGTTALNEEVEFTGYFFKRWAYESQGGIHVAPLMLAKLPRWEAPVGATSAELPLGTLLLAVVGTAIVGVGAAWIAFRRAGDSGPTATSPRPLQ